MLTNFFISLAAKRVLSAEANEILNVTIRDTSSTANYRIDQPKIDRRSLVIGLGLAGGGAFSYFNSPRAMAAPISPDRFQQMIPAKVGRWTSRKSAELVLPAEDKGRDKLYENIETRIYECEGLPAMMLMVAYSSVQRNDVQVHRPEVCYPAAGFPIIWTRPAMIDVGSREVSGRELVADRGGLKERIVYWVRVGDEFPTDWTDQRLIMAKANLRGITPDGVLFRVSMIEVDPASSVKALDTFIKAFVGTSASTFRNGVLL